MIPCRRWVTATDTHVTPPVGHGGAARHGHLQRPRPGQPDDLAAVDGEPEAVELHRSPARARGPRPSIEYPKARVSASDIAGQSSSVAVADLDHAASLAGRRARGALHYIPGDGHRHVRRRHAHLRGARAPGRRPPRPGGRRRRVPRARRPVGLRQVDDAADARRAGAGRRGHDPHRRPRRHDGAAEGPRHRHGLPVLRAVPAHDGGREHRLPPQGQADPQGRARPPGPRGGPDPRPRAVPRPQAGQAVGRPAPAGGDGPGHRARAAGVPDGRAAVEPRRQAAGADAHPDRRPAAPPRRDHGLRHPRPGRGDDDGRPRRRARPGRAAAVRVPEGAVHRPGQRVRRRVHRVAGDEPAGRPRSATTARRTAR